jgi:signal transduction histidine kinase
MQFLQQTAQKIATGDYAQRLDATRKDEIGVVMQSFNTMATAVEKRDGQLNSLNQELKTRFNEAEDARERAEQSDRVKSAFLASMSHELRTPLNSILNFSKFVMRGVMGPVTDRQTETLEKVVKAAKHLLNLINDVLDMSKIESNSLTLFVEEDVDLRPLIQSAVDTAESLLEDKPVEIKVTISEDLPLLRADKQRILQIMLNLLSNACKFTDEGTIHIHAWHEADEVHIRIHDTGVGIAPEDQALVFEAFKQTESGLRQGGGTGLGMPISRSLAEAHQGRLWLEDSADGGATFHVALPVKSDQLAPIPA